MVTILLTAGSVFHGLSASAANPPLYTLNTPNPPNPPEVAEFGTAMASGDVNGDGKADIVVGAPLENVDGNGGQGRVYAFSGADGTLLGTLTTPNPDPQAQAHFGSAVTAADVNGDGKADIVVGAPDETVAGITLQGRAYAFSGADGSLLYTLNTPNPQASAQFGIAVAAGDANQDGKADIVVGAMNETVGGNQSQGRAYVFSGADGSLLYTLNTPNPQASAGFGSAAAAGDANSDGKADIIVGAIGEPSAETRCQGRVYAFSGADGSLLRTLTTPNPQAYAGFGGSVAAGDMNADGKADIIVGSIETVGGHGGQGRVYAFSGGRDAVAHADHTQPPGLGLVRWRGGSRGCERRR